MSYLNSAVTLSLWIFKVGHVEGEIWNWQYISFLNIDVCLKRRILNVYISSGDKMIHAFNV